MNIKPLVIALVLGTSSLQSQIINPGLTGNTLTDGWENLTNLNLLRNFAMVTGGFPRSPRLSAPWTASIAANEAGSNGGGQYVITSGNGFASGSGIYSPFVNSGFSVSSGAPLAGLDTIVLQVYASTGEQGIGILVPPSLNLNGGSQAFVATDFALVYSRFGGEFDPDGNGLVSFFNNVYAYQWDVSSFEGPISSFQINYVVRSHSTTYGLRLDQSDVYTQVIPEPTTAVLLGGVSLAALLLKRRRVSVRS